MINNQIVHFRVTSLLVLLAASEPPVQAAVVEEAQQRRCADIQFVVISVFGVICFGPCIRHRPLPIVHYDVTGGPRERFATRKLQQGVAFNDGWRNGHYASGSVVVYFNN